MPAARLATILLLASLPAAPQTLRGGDYVATDFVTRSVYRVPPGSPVTPLHAGAPLRGPAGVAVTASLEVLVVDWRSSTLYRLAPGKPIAPVATGLGGPIRVAVDRNGDYLVTALTTRSLLRVTPNGRVATIRSGAPFQRPFDVAVDGNGDYLVADDRTRALYRVRPNGALSTIHQGAPLQLPQGVALFPNGDYAVIDGRVDAVFRIARGSRRVTRVLGKPPLDNPCGITEDFEGRVVVSESSISGNRLLRVDRNGATSVIAQGAPFRNLEDVARAPRLTGPLDTRPGRTTTYTLDFPGESGSIYVMFASQSVFPGFALSRGDPRASPCNFDSLLQASIGANNALFVRWSGAIAADGRATAALVLPNARLPALTLHQQAITVDFTRPSGVASMSNLHVVRLLP